MTWEDITIKQFNKLTKVVETHQKNADSDQITYAVELVSACTNKSVQECLDMPFNELKHFCDDLSFMEDKPKGRLNPSVTINGTTYVVSLKVKDITTAQYIDYTETLKNDPENIALMCAIFCIPKGHAYNEGYDVMELAQEFYEHFKIVDAIGISFFFTKLLQSYVRVTLSFLKRKLKKQMKLYKKNKTNLQEIQKMQQSIEALESAGGLILS